MKTLIKNEDGQWVAGNPLNGQLHRIVDDNDHVFVESYHQAPTEISKEEAERAWKNAELIRTQSVRADPDYRYHAEMSAYRQALMDWTDTDDFPDVRPVMPLTKNGFPIY